MVFLLLLMEFGIAAKRKKKSRLKSGFIWQLLLIKILDSGFMSTGNCQLRGVRNTAHSNYGNDYFRMDGVGNDGLMINGKSADYLGVDGQLRYRAQLKAVPEGGTMQVIGDELFIEGADAVTIYFAASTNFVNYNDVSGDQVTRVTETLNGINAKPYHGIWKAAIEDYQSYYRRDKNYVKKSPGRPGPSGAAKDRKRRHPAGMDRRLRAAGG